MLNDVLIITEKDNILLKRREIRCILKNVGGKISRAQSVELLRSKLNIDKLIIPVKLRCEYGTNNVEALFYIYDNKDIAKKYLPSYILKRVGLEEKGDKNGKA